MKLAQLQAVEAPVEVKFGTETIVVRYRPGAFTEPFLEKLSEQLLNDALAAVVVGWDLQDDAGAPYPTTAEAIAELPLLFRRAAYRAIHEAAFPN